MLQSRPMDVNELNKTQLILLSLLITFVVSIATGIVTVSLMNQAPKSVPQTINNIIQRTIEKVSTVEVPTTTPDTTNTVTPNETQNNGLVLGDGNALINIYETDSIDSENIEGIIEEDAEGEGVLLSEIGLVLVEKDTLKRDQDYSIVLEGNIYQLSILKEFNNGFVVLKISETEPQAETAEQSQNENTTNN